MIGIQLVGPDLKGQLDTELVFGRQLAVSVTGGTRV